MAAADRTADVWGERTPFAGGSERPARVETNLAVPESELERWVQSACVLCSNGCGMDIAVAGGRIVGMRGRAADRVNHGRLGPKGLYGWQASNSPDRLTRPLLRRDGQLQEASWDEAMDLIVTRSRDLLETMGPLAFGFYTSGQLFSEEYYAQTKVARAGLGTPHLAGNTRLCTATAEWALIELRLRRRPRLLHRHRRLRHALLRRAQRRRDADGALDAHARPAARPRPAAPGRRRSAADPRGAGSGCLAADPVWNESRVAQRDPA
jgi:hypothetical protein